MKKGKKFFITLGTFAVLLVIFFFITSSITKYTGYSITDTDDKTDFEKCLEEQHLVLYINTADSTKTLQEIQLIDYLQYFDIINCKTNNKPCLENKVNKFPTWEINEYKLEEISFSDLIKFSGCRFV